MLPNKLINVLYFTLFYFTVARKGILGRKENKYKKLGAKNNLHTHSLVASPPNHKIPHASLVPNVVYSRCGVVYPDLSPVFCLQLLEKGLLIEGISFTGKQFID